MTEAPRRPAGEAGRIAYFAYTKDGDTYRAALSVVSLEGDPEEFVYTEPVAVNRLVQRLLGPRLEGYVIGRVLLEPLVEQVKTAPAVVLLDDAAVLQRALAVGVPAVVIAAAECAHREGAWSAVSLDGAAPRLAAWVAPEARENVLSVLKAAAAAMAPFSLTEPFRQVRAALAELGHGG